MIVVHETGRRYGSQQIGEVGLSKYVVWQRGVGRREGDIASLS